LTSSPPYDPRAIANLLLDLADADGLRLTNLTLQKLLYFAHGRYLVRTKQPLVSGHFEAWTYGPVHPAVYRSFRADGDQPIRSRAAARNIMTGAETPIPAVRDQDLSDHLKDILRSLGRLSAGRLVDISHAADGPWQFVVNKAKTDISLGLRIPDSVTLERFKFLKVSVGPKSRVGEPNEDSPLI